MKKLNLLILVIFSSAIFVGCEKEEISEKKPITSIIGTWQLIEIYSDPGDGSGGWNSVENGYKYTFSSDNKFNSNRFTECTNGEYNIDSNKLILNYECEGFTAGIEDPEGTFVEELSFTANNIILKPTYLDCIEGCGWKFKKLQ
ncbi:lipocalin family protein [Salegentibacter maritimus]|uniref:Lipocalin family protein n=1 Tax=Salegentibacter maritimus TaxID=2794347 RepID=A0ABS0TKZ0_9FLAO|nr:lipocalin family protein [Salegentibacter maritimus]MBI6121465.1 lipocalin family protein [Salegentibacter maritimus]